MIGIVLPLVRKYDTSVSVLFRPHVGGYRMVRISSKSGLASKQRTEAEARTNR